MNYYKIVSEASKSVFSNLVKWQVTIHENDLIQEEEDTPPGCSRYSHIKVQPT
jgi:hypothetical protein